MLCSHSREPDFLIKVMQVGIREFLPLPLSRKDLEAAVTRVWISQKRHQVVDGQDKGKVLVVTGHKGGSGTTTVAVNLAVALGGTDSGRSGPGGFGQTVPGRGKFSGPGAELLHSGFDPEPE